MKASNIFYATAHFTVTAVVLLALTVAGGREHSRWRNVLGLSTALALASFALYPTLPPRLLPDHPALIDTLSEIGGFWSFETPAIERIADPYAAMPSLHLIWAAWVSCAVWKRLMRRWMRAVAIIYPLVTVTVMVATANHYIRDRVAVSASHGSSSSPGPARPKTLRAPRTDRAHRCTPRWAASPLAVSRPPGISTGSDESASAR